MSSNGGIKLKARDTIVVLLVLHVFFTQLPYFTWSTFCGGAFGRIYGMQYSTAFALLAVFLTFLLPKNKLRIKIYHIVIIISAVFTVAVSGGISHALSFEWIPYIVIFVFLLLPKELQFNVYSKYKTIIAITAFFAIIVYLITLVYPGLPSVRLESYEPYKQATGQYYNLYGVSVNRVAKTLSDFGVRKLCGLFDEPGRLGTICALFLVSEKMKIKGNFENVILFTAGVLTFSLAFFLIIIIYLVVSLLPKLSVKAICIIGLLIVLYVIFINFNFSNADLRAFQKRFIVTGNVLAGDNRTNIYYDIIFNDFKSSDFITLLFGNGAGAMSLVQNQLLVDGYSYKNLLYDYGYVGFGCQIVFLAMVLVELLRKNKVRYGDMLHCIALFIVYLANMYQRPTMFSFNYFLIFIGGILIVIKDQHNHSRRAELEWIRKK